MDAMRDKIRAVSVGLLDRRTKSTYGLERSNPEALAKQEVELSGKKLRLIDYVQIGTDFVHDGSMVMSSENLARYFPMRNGLNDPLAIVDLGLIQLKSPAEVESVTAKLTAMSPNELDVLTKQQIIDREIRFWARRPLSKSSFRSAPKWDWSLGRLSAIRLSSPISAITWPSLPRSKRWGIHRFISGS